MWGEGEPGFVVSVLGGFGLQSRNRAGIRLSPASQRLVVYLALHSGMVRRTAVAGSLWPDAVDRRAYASLRSTLARLERSGVRALHVTKSELALAENVAVDIRHSRALARRLLDPRRPASEADLGPATREALSAELLPGWYDDWVLIEADRWRQLRLHALEALARGLIANGRCGEAADAAGTAIRADPLRESARATLITVHLAEGNQSEALREFAGYRQLLQTELGLQPTTRLYGLLHGLPIRRDEAAH